MLGIMVGMDQETWFAGFGVVPRAVLLLVVRPQMPVIMAGMDHGTVWGFTGAVLGQGLLLARCCPTFVLVQTVFYTVAFPQLQFITVVDDASRCVPFFVGRPVLPGVMYGLGHSW